MGSPVRAATALRPAARGRDTATWESASRVAYDLATGMTWLATERRPGEYQFTLTRREVDAGALCYSGQADASRLSALSALAGSLAGLLGISVSAATRLLEGFGSLAALRRADPAVLRATHGLSPRQTRRLADALDLATSLLLEPRDEQPQVRGPHDAARLVLPEMGLLEREQMRLLLLNTRNRLIAAVTLYHGTTSECPVRVAEIMREAVRHNAVALIVVHNHPSGTIEPSPDDVRITRSLVRAGELLDISVLDHLVVSSQSYTSLRERGLGWS